MRVRLIQSAPRLGDIEYNFEQCREQIREAVQEKADLVVFPELALNGYLLKDMVALTGISDKHEIVRELAGMSREIAIMVGLVELGEDCFHYNSAFYFEGGELRFRHRKSHLPTYGMFDEGRYFAAGRRMRSFESELGCMGVLICEDAWHSINPYILCQDGAQVLLIISNSPVRGITRNEGFMSVQNWEVILRTYALLHSCYIVYVNRVGCEDGISFSGSSCVVGPGGRIATRLPFLEEARETVEIDSRELFQARTHNPVLKGEKYLENLNELKRIAKKAFGH